MHFVHLERQTDRNRTNLYQSLAYADDVTKVLDGRPEPFLHVAAEENGGGWRKVAQCRDLK